MVKAHSFCSARFAANSKYSELALAPSRTMGPDSRGTCIPEFNGLLPREPRPGGGAGPPTSPEILATGGVRWRDAIQADANTPPPLSFSIQLCDEATQGMIYRIRGSTQEYISLRGDVHLEHGLSSFCVVYL